MDYLKKIVTRLPLVELWNSLGLLPISRRDYLDAVAIKQRLRTGGVVFVVADVGSPLMWVMGLEAIRLWRKEVKSRLVQGSDLQAGFRLEASPGGYAYVASEWTGAGSSPVIVLEKHH